MKRLFKIALILTMAAIFCCCGELFSPKTTERVPEAETTEPFSTVEEDELTLITPVPTDTPEPPTPTPEPTPTPTPSPTPTPEPTPEPAGLIGWTQGGFVPREEQTRTETEYIGENLHFTVTRVFDDTSFKSEVTYYVTDIYLRNIKCLRTAAAKSFKSGVRDNVDAIAKRANALLAISGDMFNAHKHRLVIRNGEVFDTKLYSNWEVCFLYLDGTMETLSADEYRMATLRDDIWQGWQFGPSLLDQEGHAISVFSNAQIRPQNPRSAIGYYEPGHYCFVTVDGRQKGHSMGLELAELSRLMEQLGCKLAFNLDGGQSASLFWNDQIYSKPCNGGRDMADIVYLIDADE